MNPSEKSKKNLIYYTKETAKEAGSKGGKASAESRRRKKKMKQAMNLLLSLPPSEEYIQTLKVLGIDEIDADNQMLMLASAFNQALKGNVKAMNFIKDITGSTAANEAELQRIKLEREKLKLERERLELLKAKLNLNEEEIADDGFIEALNNSAKDDWNDLDE